VGLKLGLEVAELKMAQRYLSLRSEPAPWRPQELALSSERGQVMQREQVMVV